MAISHRCCNSVVSSDIRRMFEDEWDWYELSSVIPLADIRRYPDLPWDTKGLWWNSTLSIDDIQSLSEIDGEWNWNAISSTISMEEVSDNVDLPWSKSGLSCNHTLTVDDIQSLPDIEWNWDMIPCEIRIIDVYTHPDLTWNRSGLSENKNIRIGDLIAWHEIVPSIYRRWQYSTDVVIV